MPSLRSWQDGEGGVPPDHQHALLAQGQQEKEGGTPPYQQHVLCAHIQETGGGNPGPTLCATHMQQAGGRGGPPLTENKRGRGVESPTSSACTHRAGSKGQVGGP